MRAQPCARAARSGDCGDAAPSRIAARCERECQHPRAAGAVARFRKTESAQRPASYLDSWLTKDIDHDRAARSLSVLNAQTLNGACVGVGSRTCLKGHGDAFPLKGVARAPGRA